MITLEELRKKHTQLMNEALESGIREIDICTLLVTANITTQMLLISRPQKAGVI